jgi:glycosyltransferase involved in cell wall biosynthesis
VKDGRTGLAAVKISVVVPAYNEEGGLAASLHSMVAAMSAFDRRGWSSELIVCDNNSTDRTADIARAAGATVVFERVNQISRARNAGAARATGDWLIFVDADSHPTPELFDDAAEAIAKGALAGGSTFTFNSSRADLRIAERVWNMLSRINRWAAGSFIFCDAAAFRELGGFTQRLYAAEEIDLFRRLKRMARRQRRPIVILHRHPLRTSDRKVHLYSSREMLRFYTRTIVSGGRALQSPDECFAWYDGRR